MIEGVYTALITPFKEDGALDEKGLEMLIVRQIEGGVNGIVLLGTTGEAPTLSHEENRTILKIARACIKPPCQFVVGTGSYSTAATIENTLEAQAFGADAALVVTPYYNKPTQQGLYKHFEALCNKTDIPIILYNIQGRTGQNLQTETLQKLLALKNILSVKEASGQIQQIMDVINVAKKKPDFTVLSGDDNITLPVMALGGSGVISVLSNLVPELIVSLYNACKNNAWDEARELHYQLLPLFKGIFLETNPIPIKQLMIWEGLPAGPCRLPLCSLTKENEVALKQIFRSLPLSLYA